MRAAGDQASFDEQMRIVPHDLAILAGARLGLVGVDDEIARAAVGLLGHERPFHAGRESGAAAAALAGRLHFVDDGVAALVQDRLGAVPGAARARAGKPPIVAAVEILKMRSLSASTLLIRVFDRSVGYGGFGTGASCTLAASPGFLASLSLKAAPVWTACRSSRTRSDRSASSRRRSARKDADRFAAGLRRFSRGEIVENARQRLRRQVLVIIGVDLHHRRVDAGAQALDLGPGEHAVGGDVDSRSPMHAPADLLQFFRRRAACTASCRTTARGSGRPAQG